MIFVPHRISALLALVVGSLVVASGSSQAASTGASVVGATVVGSTSITNACSGLPARSLGAVTVGSTSLTATDAGVCRFEFGASSAVATARIAQRDRTGSALERGDASFTSSRPADPGFTALDMADASVSFAGRSDGQILRSIDNGASWSVEDSGTTASIGGISTIDATNAYAIGNCGIWCLSIRKRTTAGGSTWAAQTVPPGVLQPLQDVAHQPATPDTAVIVGDGGMILRTTDGGTNWAIIASGTTSHLTSVAFFSPTLAYAAGFGGTLLRSIDAGATWQPIASTTTIDIVDVEIAPGPTLFFATAKLVFRSTDPAAATPTISNAGTLTGSCAISSLAAPTASTVMLGGNHACSVMRSTNANVASPTYARTGQGSIGTGVEIDASSATNALLAVSTGAIDRTVDGTSWVSVRAESSRVMGIDHLGSDVAYAVGGNGFAWVTTNGGASWTTRPTGSTRHVNDVDVVSSTEAWAAGAGGRVYHTTDTGATWTELTTGMPNELLDIERLEDGTLLVVGTGGYIGRSTSSGTSWTTISSGTADPINEISLDQETGRLWIAGGVLATSTDRGASFVNQQVALEGTTMPGIAAAGGMKAWALGSSKLYSTTDGGATWTQVPGAVFAFGSGIESASPSHVLVAQIGPVQSRDGGSTFTALGGAGRGELSAIDANRAWHGGEAGAITRTGVGASIPDYVPGAWAGAGSTFGACLQAVDADTVPTWTVDSSGIAGQCEADDADPWNAVPASPTTVATTTTAGVSGQLDFVWGLRTSSSQAPGEYSATIDVEVVSP